MRSFLSLQKNRIKDLFERVPIHQMSVKVAFPERQIVRDWVFGGTEELETIVLVIRPDDQPIRVALDNRPILLRALDNQLMIGNKGKSQPVEDRPT
jgi:hypothetical protein